MKAIGTLLILVFSSLSGFAGEPQYYSVKCTSQQDPSQFSKKYKIKIEGRCIIQEHCNGIIELSDRGKSYEVASFNQGGILIVGVEFNGETFFIKFPLTDPGKTLTAEVTKEVLKKSNNAEEELVIVSKDQCIAGIE